MWMSLNIIQSSHLGLVINSKYIVKEHLSGVGVQSGLQIEFYLINPAKIFAIFQASSTPL